MKKIILICIILKTQLTFGQNKTEISFGISNPGQVEKTLEDFYFIAHPTAFQDDAHYGNEKRVKFNLGFSFHLRDSLELRFRVGYSKRVNHYSQAFSNTHWSVNDFQSVFEISPSFGFSKRLGRFRFSTGIEIPVYIIGKLKEDLWYQTYASSGTIDLASTSEISMPGGTIIGLNNYVRVSTFLSKQLFLYSEINYGLLFASLGGNFRNVTTSTFPIEETLINEFEKTYTKWYFSPAQIQFGIGLKF